MRFGYQSLIIEIISTYCGTGILPVTAATGWKPVPLEMKDEIWLSEFDH
ncbi:MAG: hypothetical protein F6K47_13650 [Symploca sp. SIO2E6]|nr:hypothetical protein [Symploca sp. SIO2E6]